MTRPQTLSAIESGWQALGAKPSHVRRLFRAWMHLGPWEARPSDTYPKALTEALPRIRAELQAMTRVLPLQSRQADSVKLVVGLPDGQCVESVLLPREALCVSTQVGCAVGCLFCRTGRGGLVRQLSSAEIVAQVAEALALRPALKKVVLMGMGEPSHNWNNVREAVEFLGDVVGFAHKQLVVSTVGDDRLFDALPTMTVKPALALSLHTMDDAKRAWLLPRAPRLSVGHLLERTLAYAEATKYPAQIEWTLIEGLNDDTAQVEALAEQIRGRHAMVNFIAVNPVEGNTFRRPSRAHIEDLITILRAGGTVATLRESAAQDIEGGCGQLRARWLEEPHDEKETETELVED